MINYSFANINSIIETVESNYTNQLNELISLNEKLKNSQCNFNKYFSSNKDTNNPSPEALKAFIEYCDNLISIPPNVFFSLPLKKSLRADILCACGSFKANNELLQEALKNFDEGLSMSEIEDITRNQLFTDRGGVKIKLGLFLEAINDLDNALNISGITGDLKARGFNNRGFAKLNLSLFLEAIKDFDLALATSNIANDTKYKSLYGRGTSKAAVKRYQESIQDFDDALRIPEIETSSIKDSCLHNRSVAKAALKY